MKRRIVRVFVSGRERAYYRGFRIPLWVAHWICDEDEWPRVEDVAGGIALFALVVSALVLGGVL